MSITRFEEDAARGALLPLLSRADRGRFASDWAGELRLPFKAELVCVNVVVDVDLRVGDGIFELEL